MTATAHGDARHAMTLVDDASDDALPLRLLPAGVKRAVGRMKHHDIGELASGIAFRVFLSIFPALIAAVALLGLVMAPSDIATFADDPPAFMPENAVELLRRPLLEHTERAGAGSGALAITGVLGGLWAATTAATVLIKALDRINGVDEPRPFLKQRAIAMVLTLALFGAIGVIMALLVFGPQLQRLLLPGRLVYSPVRYLVGTGQVVGAVAVLTTLFSFVYWLAPNRRPRGRWRWSTPGGLVAVAGWLLFAGGFTLYVQTAGSYDATYGALAGVVILLVWLHLTSMSLLFGGEVDAGIRELVGVERALAEAVGMDPLEPAARSAPAQRSAPGPGRRTRSASAARQGAVLAGAAAGLAMLTSLRGRRRAAG